MEHVLRACLIALRLADKVALDDAARCETYGMTLLATVCTGESFELVGLFGDDIAFRAGMYHAGPSQPAQRFYLLGRAGRGVPGASFRSHTALTAEVAQRIGLEATVGQALAQTFARWDGKGVPSDIAGEQLCLSVRLMRLAEFAEVHHRLQRDRGRARARPPPRLLRGVHAPAPGGSGQCRCDRLVRP